MIIITSFYQLYNQGRESRKRTEYIYTKSVASAIRKKLVYTIYMM